MRSSYRYILVFAACALFASCEDDERLNLRGTNRKTQDVTAEQKNSAVEPLGQESPEKITLPEVEEVALSRLDWDGETPRDGAKLTFFPLN